MPPPTHRSGEPPEFRTTNLTKLFLFLLKFAIMAVIFSIFLSFLGFAAIVLLHFIFMSKAFRRRYTASPTSTPIDPPYTHARLVNVVYSAAAAFRRNRDCAICLDSFQEEDDCSGLPVCGHLFHANCVDRWILKTPNCPICRTGLFLGSGLPGSSISGDDTWKRLWPIGFEQGNSHR